MRSYAAERSHSPGTVGMAVRLGLADWLFARTQRLSLVENHEGGRNEVEKTNPVPHRAWRPWRWQPAGDGRHHSARQLRAERAWSYAIFLHESDTVRGWNS